MPHSRFMPESMGTATIEPSGAFEAGSYQSFVLTYTAGPFGIDDSGTIKIVWRHAADMGTPQFDDPAAPNYVTAEASNGAVLELRFDIKDNIRPWDKTLRIKVVRGFFEEGDRIVVRFGDTRQGSPGIRIQTFCEDSFEFRVLADPIATYDFVELPEQPAIAIVPGPPVAWKAVLPTLRWPGDRFALKLKGEDIWGNPSDRCDASFRLRPSRPVPGLPETLRFSSGQFSVICDDLVAESGPDLTVDLIAEDGSLAARTNPLRIADDSVFRHYWGDTHGQSEETIGTNSARAYFAFARDRAFVDVTCHQGNDFQITEDFWRHLNDLTREFNEDGRFVAIPGYEWSGNTALGGDRNVMFREEGRPIRRSSHVLVEDMSDIETDCHTAGDLFAALKAAGEDCVCLAHVGGRYADVARAHDPALEPSVEVHSAWGTFEWILEDALRQGYRVGIVANSDGHKGRPGASYPGAGMFGSYGGLTCFLAPELKRDAIFDCWRKRRHYGTTGARLYLDVRASCNGTLERFNHDPHAGPAQSEPVTEALMGDIVSTDADRLTLAIEVVGSAPVERIEIRNGLGVLETFKPFAEAELGRRIRVIWEGSEYRGRGRQTRWDGTAQLEGNAFEQATPINFWNKDKTLDRGGDTRLQWESMTTGGLAGFDALLADGQTGTLKIDTPLVQCDVPVGEIGYDDTVFEAGGLGRRLRVFRLPDVNPHAHVTLERQLPVTAARDDAFYVCVTQADGHQAWSSPIYVIP